MSPTHPGRPRTHALARAFATCALAAGAALVPISPADAEPAPAEAASPAADPASALAGAPSVQGAELDGLLVTLDRVYRLSAIYDRAAADFGARGPLAAARQAHRDRLARLVRLYRRYGIAVPANPWTARTPSFATRGEACLAAFRAELDLATALDDLTAAAGRPELASAYARARDASRGSWLEGLRACALSGA